MQFLPFLCEKQNICSMLWGIKASGSLLRMEASYFVDAFLTGKIKDSRAATVKESYINITERQYMSLAAAQPAKWNLQCIRPWRMQETQNHLALIIVFQMQVTRKAIYVHC